MEKKRIDATEKSQQASQKQFKQEREIRNIRKKIMRNQEKALSDNREEKIFKIMKIIV